MLSMRPIFNLRCLASQFLIKNGAAQVSYRNLNSKKTPAKEETLDAFSFQDDIDEEEIKAKEAAIEQKRNVSELLPSDYNKQHGRPPYEEPQWEYHQSLLYRRRLYGKYGKLSKVDPSILWPSKTELDYMKEYEEIAQPFTFQTLLKRSREKKALAEAELQKEEAEILEKVKNINFEIVEFHKRVALQKQKALKLIENKNKLIEKVKEQIGYRIDVRSAKFKEMLEKLQNEERKNLKLKKKALREEKKKEFLASQEAQNEEKETKQES